MSLEHTNRINKQHSGDRELQLLSDEEIMSEIQEDNGDAFTVLFDRYHRLVMVTALKIVRDVAEAEEVTQNVFFEVYRAARQFDPAKGTLKGWLLQFAYHRGINRRNYLVLRQFYNRLDFDDVLASDKGATSSHQLPVQEAAHLVEEALKTLNEPVRRIIQMAFFEGMTLREVSERTQQSFNSVRNHYYRGLAHLRTHLTSRSVELRSDGALPVGQVSRVKA